MSPLGRKKKDDEPEAAEATELSQVPTDAPAPATAAGGAEPPPPEPAARVEAVPPPAAATPQPEPVRPTPAPEAGGPQLIGGELAEQRPELIVAGAFVGAFLFARILNRIAN